MPGLLRVQKKVFAQKTSPRTFSELVISSKIPFLANVAAKVATTPKNSEKSCFCSIFEFFGDLCQKKSPKIGRYYGKLALFRIFRFHRNCPKLPKKLFWPMKSRATAVIIAGFDKPIFCTPPRAIQVDFADFCPHFLYKVSVVF